MRQATAKDSASWKQHALALSISLRGTPSVCMACAC